MKYTDGLWYDETRAVALAYDAKFEWPDLAEGVSADPVLSGKVESTGGAIEYNERLIRQHVHAARAETGTIRRDRHLEPLR